MCKNGIMVSPETKGAATNTSPTTRADRAATFRQCGCGRLVARAASVPAFAAGIGILAMMAVTCLDVILRRLGTSVPGAYDIVRLAGGIIVAAALPRTTAVKGHVAIEYFFHRMGAAGRLAVDSLMRTLQSAGFAYAAWSFARKGASLLRDGEVTPTLQIPVFWLAWLIAASCALCAAISLYHLAHPGKELTR